MTPGEIPWAQRGGFALAAVLFTLVAIQILGLGMLIAATREATIAGMHERLLRLRIEAESLVLDSASRTREAPSWLIVDATTRAPNGARASATALLVSPDPRRFAPLLAAGQLMIDDDVTEERGWSPELIDAWWDELRRLADRTETGTIELRPVALDHACRPDAPGNWGAPTDPAHPCHPYVPVIYAPHPIHIVAGIGTGILIAEDAVRFAPGSMFLGSILSRGRVEIPPDADVRGSVTTFGESVYSASFLTADTALALAVIDRAASLRRPRPAPRFWLPSF